MNQGRPSPSRPPCASNFVKEEQYTLITLAASRAGEEIDRIFLRRDQVAAEVTERSLSEGGILGTFYLPGGDGPFPGMLVLGGSGGGIDKHRARLLTSRGYATLALDYFGGPGLSERLSGIPLEYFGDALDWLQAQPAVDGDRLGILGASRGGELALLVGATYPRIGAVVSYVGSGAVAAGFPEAGEPTAAWTYEGEPLAYARSPAELEERAIPVEQIQGPVLLISGEDDQIWPSAELSEAARVRLEEHAHPYPFAHLRYEDAGHYLSPPYWPTTDDITVDPVLSTMHGGGTPAGNAHARTAAWAEVLSFLDEALR